ncbi:hypothetical protein KEM55_005243 [Ascosphaera atra]|nr:hypothetical protein KEM55_005243 [Ascosphaera atra]
MLIDAPTKVEKEILSLVENGVVRRLLIPGRAGDAAALGDCLILMDDWKEMVRVSSALKQSLKDKFIALLSYNTKTSSVSTSAFSPDEVSALVRSGFLVSPSAIAKSTSANPDITSVSVQSSSPSSTPPATAAAAERITSKPAQKFRDTSMFLSIPNLGAYFRLLSAARTRLLAMLKKSSFNEAPLYLLRDRWNGAVEVSTPHEVAKRIRGESTGVLPGRTKMWKELYGLNFRWCLEEALGAGLIEIFETGSVGPAVRRV